ncbi:Uncharacterised protein [Klebsiella aerogenes]|nr:Uncharacterised protein [Klebsiella aerogenes]
MPSVTKGSGEVNHRSRQTAVSYQSFTEWE